MKKVKKFFSDPLRVGVFLLGVSALILALIALSFYLKSMAYQSQEYSYKPNLYGICRYKTIIINAYNELKDVAVLDEEGSVLCSFDRIPPNSDEVCKVPSEGVYVIRAGEVKRVVICEKELMD